MQRVVTFSITPCSNHCLWPFRRISSVSHVHCKSSLPSADTILTLEADVFDLTSGKVIDSSQNESAVLGASTVSVVEWTAWA